MIRPTKNSKFENFRIRVNVEPSSSYVNVDDDGRVPLGNFSDKEAEDVRQLILNSVSNETKTAWEYFVDETKDKVVKALFEEGEFCRSYPKKIKSIQGEQGDYESPSTSGPTIPQKFKSQNHFVKFDDKYKINRKPTGNQESSEIPKPPKPPSPKPVVKVIEQKKPEISAIRRKEICEELVSLVGKRKPKVVDVLGEDEPTVTPGMALLSNYGYNTSNTPTPSITPAEENVEECILHKYGHCWNPDHCPFAHDGVVTPNLRPSIKCLWDKKDESVALCPGYLNNKCWNQECNLRHTIYQTDSVVLN